MGGGEGRHSCGEGGAPWFCWVGGAQPAWSSPGPTWQRFPGELVFHPRTLSRCWHVGSPAGRDGLPTGGSERKCLSNVSEAESEAEGIIPHSCNLTPSLPSTACAFQTFFFFFNSKILPLKCTDTLPDTHTHIKESPGLSRRRFYLKAWAGLTGALNAGRSSGFL